MPEAFPDLLTSQDVASLFKVDSKTVVRWAEQRRLQFIRTPGGHLRFVREHVLELMKLEGGDEHEG